MRPSGWRRSRRRSSVASSGGSTRAACGSWSAGWTWWSRNSAASPTRARRWRSPYPWQGSPQYFLRAVDQGIGRALWFIHGAQALDVAAAVASFAEHRRPDLWSGVGLAATFAGGCDTAGLATLRRAAGGYHGELA